MINVTTHFSAPMFILKLKDDIDRIDNIEDYLFVIQLHYRDMHTVCPLNKVESINFEEHFMEIRHNNGSCNIYNYDNISEYHIINADDISDLWGNEI